MSDLDIVSINVYKDYIYFIGSATETYLEDDDLDNKIYRIVLENKVDYIDITVPIENDFEKDIKRRDLTINAIAYDIQNSKFIDLVGGVEDIKNKKIKGICEQNFIDDPLRLLRIFRFYSFLYPFSHTTTPIYLI